MSGHNDDAELYAAGNQAATGGLASDGWWQDVSRSTANRARDWVRGRLLADPSLSDHDCDRFIASLSPFKLDVLLRRAVNDLPAKGF